MKTNKNPTIEPCEDQSSAVKVSVLPADGSTRTWGYRWFNGQERLWRVFWLGYAGPLIPLTIISGLLKEAAEEAAPPWVILLALIPLVTYQSAIAVSLWRCAPNSGWPGYKFLARVVSIVQWIGLGNVAVLLVR